MNKIYKKDEVNFAIILIVIYVVGSNISEALTANIGIAKLVPAIFHLTFTGIILAWIFKNGYVEKYGLIFPKYNLIKCWYFIPLLVVFGFGLAFGIKVQYSPLETVLYVISMMCVGFIEEIIFRGFLFVGMAKKNIKGAIAVSSLTFGIGHIVNLFSGQPLVETLVQVTYAIIVGFTLVLIFYKGGSLLPCILFHGFNNSLSAFKRTNEELAMVLDISTEKFEIIFGATYTLLIALFALHIIQIKDFMKK